MRWIVVIIVVVLIEIYAFQAIRTVTKNNVIQLIYLTVSLFVLAYMIYTFSNYDRSVGPTKYTLRAAALFLLSFVPKLVLVVFMFGEDVMRGGVLAYTYITDTFSERTTTSTFPERRKFLSQLALGMAAIPFVGLLHGVFKGKYNFRVLTSTLYFDDLPAAFEGFRLTQISDIHSGSFDEAAKIEYAVDLINEQKSDALFFTGDIVNTSASEMDDWIDTFKKIKKYPYGKHSILGNHDYGEYVTWESEAAKEANFQAIKDVHSKIDFNLLLNDSVFLEKDGDRMAVIGVENWGHNFKKAGDLEKASQNVKNEDFKILLSHDPSHWEHEVKEDQKKYHLTLSGHTHGCQFGIEIPGFFKWSPVQYLYRHWAGLYEEAGQYLYVNRGFGFHAYPGRVGIWPEITVIELRKAKAS